MISQQFNAFFNLILRDLYVFKPTIKDRFINGFIWISSINIIFKFLMPSMGMPVEYAAFIAIGNVVSWGFFDTMESVAKFIADLEGDRSISYYLSLPMPQWMTFFRLAVSNAIQAMIISIIFLPFSKLILGSALSFAKCSYFKMSIFFIIIHLFYGAFSLILASLIDNMSGISNIWMRVILPLWSLGGYQFSWQTINNISPNLSYLSLLNPLTYIMDGFRAATLGQEGFLNFWLCFFMIIIFTILSLTIGINKLLKRLDCIY